MSEVECERCTRPVSDAHVCSLCGRDAERAIGNIPALSAEVQTTISRQHRLTAQSDGGRSAESPVPFHVKAAEAMDVLRNIMVGWCKLYAEECGADLPRSAPDQYSQVVAMSRYLLRRVEWFRHHELAGSFVDEVVSSVGAVARVIDAPANRTTFAVGPCPELALDGLPCLGEIRAFIPATEHGMARMECTACHTQYATWQWLRAGKRILERMEATT